MARIRHIALRTPNQEELAAFYRAAFGMLDVVRLTNDDGTLELMLSDGEMSLAILPLATDRAQGIQHFGIQVDDVDATVAAAVVAGAEPVGAAGDALTIRDPIGQRVDLSQTGWMQRDADSAHIRHIAVMAEDPPKLAEFYAAIFGMHDVLRRPGDRRAVYISDGYINLALLPNHTEESRGKPAGINHFGFHVDDLDASLKAAYAGGARKNDYELPRDGRFAETFVFDPHGQRVDLSQVGWKTAP